MTLLGKISSLLISFCPRRNVKSLPFHRWGSSPNIDNINHSIEEKTDNVAKAGQCRRLVNQQADPISSPAICQQPALAAQLPIASTTSANCQQTPQLPLVAHLPASCTSAATFDPLPARPSTSKTLYQQDPLPASASSSKTHYQQVP